MCPHCKSSGLREGTCLSCGYNAADHEFKWIVVNSNDIPYDYSFLIADHAVRTKDAMQIVLH